MASKNKIYQTVSYGSSGSDVEKVQTLLNQYGYNLAVDGNFGPQTEKAVKDFQKNNGLEVDGIVGDNTMGSLTGGSSSSTSGKTNQPFTYKNFTYDDFTYGDYQESDIVKQASAALQAQLAQKPGEYKSQWQAQLDDTINKILNREKFSYDLNGDALYQQYKDKYIQQGKMAMGDAIGQASAMTGGYGNSYAQSVGQQAYQAQLQNLNDIVPELYQMALDKYNREGDELYNQYAMLGDAEDKDYGRYRDSVADWLTERDYLTGRLDTERNFDYSKYVDDRSFEYGKYSDDRSLAYDKYSNDKSYAYNEYRNAIEDALAREQFDYQKERDRIADEQWQKQYDAQYGSKSVDKDNDYVDNDYTPAPEPEPTEPDYSDWDASDWNSYFAQIRASEGQSAAEEELRRMTNAGLIPKNMTAYAATGARGKLGH